MATNDYSAIFQEAARAHNVDPLLLRAAVQVESSGNPNAVSEVGAQGLGQLMPKTAKALGVKNAFDPRENIFGVAKLLDENLTRYGNPEDAILAYHGGTDQNNWGPKTRAHLGKVKAEYQKLQGSKMPSTVNTIGEMGANYDAFTAYFSGNTQPAAAPANDPFSAYFGSAPTAPVQAQPVAAQVAPQQVPAQRSAFDETARQVGLTGRAAVTGLTALPTMAGDALNSLINMGIGGVNRVAGTNIPQLQMPSAVTQQAMTAAGVPQPQNATERVVQDVASAMSGTGGQFRLGQALMNVPAAQGVGAALTVAPGAQLAGAAGSAAAGGGVREGGGGTGAQLAAGLAGAAIPVMAGSAATRVLNRAAIRPAPVTPENLTDTVEKAVKNVANEAGPVASIPLEQRVALGAALQKRPTADPKAMLRQMDFQELGIDPTLGQLTRDASQYARERNIRGVAGVGDPLLARMSQQNNQLQEIVGNIRGEPLEPFQAGSVVSSALGKIDEGLRQGVTTAYTKARADAGKDLNVPLTGLAQDFAKVVRDFGDKVPSGVRNNFAELGVTSGTQRKVFTIEDADKLLKVINDNYGSDKATNTALGRLAQSVKGAVLDADPKGGPFAEPVRLARQRFQMQEAIPSLKAAAEGTTAPDDFVKRFVIGGKTEEVRALANLLKEQAPDAYYIARQQLGNEISRGAFGTNVTGDKLFAPDRYAETLRRIGSAKLGAFFTPAEIDTINRVGRVGAYINSFPSASPVNTSNTAAAVATMVGRIPDAIESLPIPGARLAGNLVRASTKGIEERQFVEQALRPNMKTMKRKLSPQEAELAAKLLLQPAVHVPPVKR